jgi:iron-sulfur cluster assembly accessory protein
MITLSPNAVEHLLSINSTEQAEKPLRISISKGGCAGLQYQMKFDSGAENDLLISERGACVRIAKDSLELLDGSTIDYEDSLNDAGFRIINPQAERSCGCGTSFELKK